MLFQVVALSFRMPECQELVEKVGTALVHHELCEREYVGLQKHQDTYQAGQCDAVEENVPQNVSLMPVPFRGRAGDDDALGINHLAHDAAAAIRGGHQIGREANLRCGNFL